ncbi:OLC1v1008860C1 [Oldenlandia corymbosa var. corymbosa]|uniref:OLC1v1008860C1 n=1 Tax=Oldenlandia corymbosa var. corymbosa TaxID=529605 RepID=A0AAV1DQ10_OLDCO|nr:OLC1v1008860C1 [Oldenlandia corymbosa var. corymbosa]
MASPHIPPELHQGILTWLPVKSLMRFKCVSKTWLSVITNDPSFTESYRGGSRGFLLSDPNYLLDADNVSFYFLSLDDHGGGSVSGSLRHNSAVDHRLKHSTRDLPRRPESAKARNMTNVVNGLVCFYNGRHTWLHNIATRESLKLRNAAYEDPRRLCEILSIGEGSAWRNVDDPGQLGKRQYGAIRGNRARWSEEDGLLYWPMSLDPNVYRPFYVLTFDAVAERFRVISSPSPKSRACYYYQQCLPNFGPVAIMFRFRGLDGLNQGSDHRKQGFTTHLRDHLMEYFQMERS